ncbi:FecR family protein [Pedobacter sp.]|uniref:FecR family protein n=1 Tax=Pedobacter sp. TaxID=1411316 RepID=UPI003D7FD887
MKNARLHYLFQLYIHQQADEAERNELMRLLTDPAHQKQAEEFFGTTWAQLEPEKEVFNQVQQKRMLQHILGSVKESIHESKKLVVPNWAYAIAAMLLLTVAIGLLFFPTPLFNRVQNNIVKNTTKVTPKPDALAGGNKAILTLADGSQIVLDDTHAGKIARQPGVNISKTADGQLVYAFDDHNQVKENHKNIAIQQNTITTPKGGQYQVNLPDGSKVWLNALSSLKFPTVFQGKERKVELTGEAYFEINPLAINKVKMPFKVVYPGKGGRPQEVEVLGTHFNINAYSNEVNAKTTLLEGSVRVVDLSAGTANLLKPGQQAIFNGQQTRVVEVDSEETIGWKNGNFVFNNMRLGDIMKQLERWYNIEIDEQHIPDTRYQGVISKYVSLSQVLHMLELTGNLKFKIDSIPGKTEKRIEILKQ